MDNALPGRGFPTPLVPAASTWAAAPSAGSAASPWPRTALLLLGSLLLGMFVGGGLLVGAFALLQLSAHHAASAAMVPVPVRDALVNLAGGAASGVERVGGPSALFFLPDWEGTEPFNILLIGIDQRDDEEAAGLPARSDTIILVRIDPRNKSAGMVSFPRDLWVDIPGRGQGKLNTAYTYGELYRTEGGGPGLLKRTLEHNFGVRVDFWARVDFHGFERIVDTLGGIVVDVDRPIKDDEYPTDDYGIERLYVPAGLQFMDGRLALRYARSRHSDNDFGRMRRQQRVLFAIRQRALQLHMLPRAPELAAQAREMVTTDLTFGQLVRLAKLAQQIDSDRVHSMLIDGQFVRESVGPGGASILVGDKERIRRGLFQLVAGMSPTEPARIEVLNGSGRVGLAAETAKYLMNLGYEVTRIDDADRSDYQETVLEVFGRRHSLADDLVATLRLTRWIARDAKESSDTADVRLIVGRDFQIPTVAPSPTADLGRAAADPPGRRP